MSTQIKAEVRSTKAVTLRTSAVTWVRMRKKKPVISNMGRFFCFNNTVFYTYFKVFQVSQVFTCGLSDLLLLAVGSKSQRKFFL
jgi:hypothetical protein